MPAVWLRATFALASSRLERKESVTRVGGHTSVSRPHGNVRELFEKRPVCVITVRKIEYRWHVCSKQFSTVSRCLWMLVCGCRWMLGVQNFSFGWYEARGLRNICIKCVAVLFDIRSYNFIYAYQWIKLQTLSLKIDLSFSWSEHFFESTSINVIL